MQELSFEKNIENAQSRGKGEKEKTKKNLHNTSKKEKSDNEKVDGLRVSVGEFLEHKTGDNFFALRIKEQLEVDLKDFILPGSLPEGEGVVFDPEIQLKKIRKLPRDKKPDALKKFRYIREIQKGALSDLKARIIWEVEHNPFIKEEDLKEIVESFQKDCVFSSQQREIISQALKKFFERKKEIELLRKKYNNQELFKNFFCKTPYGKVDVVVGPGVLMFRCFDLRDYSLVRFGSSSLEAQEKAARSGGCVVSPGRIVQKNLVGAIVADNASEHGPDYSSTTFKHEKQHAWYGLIPEKRVFVLKYFVAMIESFEKGEEEGFNVNLNRYVRSLRQFYIDHKAKDELLAYLKDGRKEEEILRILFKTKSEGGLYDYISSQQEEMLKDFEAFLIQNEDQRELLEARIQASIDKVCKSEYKEMISKAMDSIKDLQVYETRDQIIARLETVPLSFWQKEIKRALDHCSNNYKN